MGYLDASDRKAPCTVEVDGFPVRIAAKNTQKARPLGKILRVTMHWTGGGYALGYDDYHYVVAFDAATRKAHVIKTLKLTQLGEHAKMANSHNVGVSFCAMTDAVQGGSMGPCPITPEMLRVGATFVAEFCAWHLLDPTTQLTDHYAVDIEIGRRWKWDIVPYWAEFREMVLAHYRLLKAGKARFQYRGILTDRPPTAA